jgi:hypothetical protein
MAICGNGVVEEGEECDCGWEEDCLEDCCWPQRTKFLPNQVGTADRSGCRKTESMTNRKEAKVPPQSGGSKKELLTNLEVGGINS